MTHDPEVCNRIARTAQLIAVAELDRVKKDGGKFDFEAFLHGLARGVGTCVATSLEAGGIPPMLHHSAIMQFLQLVANATHAEIAELAKPDDGETTELATAPAQGRA